MAVKLYLRTRTQTIEKQIAQYEIRNKYPGFLLLLRERTLVAAGHLVAKIWEPTRIYLLGGVVEYKIVPVVRIGTKYAGELHAREALL